MLMEQTGVSNCVTETKEYLWRFFLNRPNTEFFKYRPNIMQITCLSQVMPVVKDVHEHHTFYLALVLGWQLYIYRTNCRSYTNNAI